MARKRRRQRERVSLRWLSACAPEEIRCPRLRRSAECRTQKWKSAESSWNDRPKKSTICKLRVEDFQNANGGYDSYGTGPGSGDDTATAGTRTGPGDKLGWKPHTKSMTLGELA